jgi:hypothetical protein
LIPEDVYALKNSNRPYDNYLILIVLDDLLGNGRLGWVRKQFKDMKDEYKGKNDHDGVNISIHYLTESDGRHLDQYTNSRTKNE